MTPHSHAWFSPKSPYLYLCASMLLCGVAMSVSRAESSPFGINGCAWSHIGMNTENFDREGGLKRLRALKAAGVKWDRCDLWWGRIEPEKGKFIWRDVDWVIEQYAQHGIELMPILCYGSAWQKSDAPVTDEERELFARYVHETVKRYRKHIKVWEIWNEPNITPFWSPNPDATEYAKLLKVAYQAAKKADPGCTIVGASTAGTDLAFIESLLLAGGGEYMDVVSIHPYQGDLGSLSPDKGGLADQVRGVVQLLAEHGYRKPIYLTEMGHRTTGTQGHTQVTEDQQAAYLIRSYVIAMAAGAERIFWFNLQDWDEFWGLIRQNFQPKPSFDAYRMMVKHLSGKRPVGTLELGDGIAAFVCAAPGGKPTPRNAVVVVWQTDDQAQSVRIGRRDYKIGMMPIFIEAPEEPVLRTMQRLPDPPPLSSRKRTALKPPPLPRQAAEWHEPDSSTRLVAAFQLAEPAKLASPFIIPAAQLPEGFDRAQDCTIYEVGDRAGMRGGRDLDGNLVFVAPPRDANPRVFYLYPSQSRTAAVSPPQPTLGNELLTLSMPGGKYIKSIQLKNGYTTRSDEVTGIFSASYQDSAGGWPRTDESAEVVEQWSLSGPVFQQQRSRIRFGQDRCEYEFTVTVYAGLPRVSYVGRWISPGQGASKQVNLGDSYPEGSVVTGMYGKATLPSAGVGYGPACVIQPSDHPTVTAVMVSPSGRLNTPGWGTRSVVGAGLFYQSGFPATVSADYFWYETRPPGELSTVAREHYLGAAFPPAITVGPLETRPTPR